MKLILTTAFILAAGTAFATTTTIAGCAVTLVEGANYYNKADPTCVFNTPIGSRVVVEGTEGWFPDDEDGVIETVTLQDN